MSESGLAGVVVRTPKSARPLRGFHWGPAETVIAVATGLTIIVFTIFALLCDVLWARARNRLALAPCKNNFDNNCLQIFEASGVLIED